MLKPISIIFLISIFALHEGFGQAFTCEGDFYMVLNNSGGQSQLYNVEINPITEEVVFAPTSTTGTGAILNAIGYRQTDNYIYAIDQSSYELVRVDASGNATALTTLLDLDFSAGYYAADITPDGQYMVLLSANGFPLRSREIVFIDLSDPGYPVTSSPLNGDAVLCTDIAFDPLSGILYGFDRNGNRLIKIDPDNGQVDTATYPTTDVADAMGAIFFDSFGRLYGYGDLMGESLARTFFSLNTTTGEVRDIAFGPEASQKDGCSCPYTIRLEKTVNPEVAFPCTEVEYSFHLANASGEGKTGVALYDEIPSGFTITDIVENPFGGTVVSGVGANVLWIENMNVPPGIDSVVVRVEVPATALGTYANQAMLTGLPVALGEETLSDNPRTLQPMDSTFLEIIPLAIDLEKDSVAICGDQSLILDATTYGAEYLWHDGSDQSTYTVEGQGWYAVTVSTPCDIAIDSVWVYTLDLDFSVDLGPDLEIEEGETILLEPDIFPDTEVDVLWIDPIGNTLSCQDCLQPIAQPFDEVTYTLEVDNGLGCIATDDIMISVRKIRGVFAPNVFSPNGDGNNDFFYLQGARDFDVNVFRIFNRWGALVYEKENIQLNAELDGWDGSFRGTPVNPDVYVWYARVEYPNGEEVLLEGDVLVLK